MRLFIILVIVISILEIRAMLKMKQKREIAVFIVFALITVSLGCFYFSNTYRESLAGNILRILEKRF